MIQVDETVDAVIIGGGFYGAVIAIYLAQRRGFRRVVLLEKEAALLRRASYHNQARVHRGYHYPRSFTTAFRSCVNFPRFIADWPHIIKKNFLNLYAVSRKNSKVTAKQFERFCYNIGASLKPVDASLKKMFNPQLIEEVFIAEEHVFDAVKLAEWANRNLADCGVQICLATQAQAVFKASESGRAHDLIVKCASATGGESQQITSRYVFNCTYSRLNHLAGDFPGLKVGLKHEVAEMALVEMPPALDNLGITVMDGAFFSMMPFPARALHTVSHVRYTPHFSWLDKRDIDPIQQLRASCQTTRADLMMRDIKRYIPLMDCARYVDSLFEVKTVLTKNEGDDGRPIVFEKHADLPNCYSILGGKIDNIYDILEILDKENFDGEMA